MASERFLKRIVDDLIERTYGKPTVIAEEVPLPHGRGRIDLVYLYNDEPYVIAVELKLWDWRTGLRQALRNTFYAKYSFLAIQWKRKRQVKLDLFRKFGIGLIVVNDFIAEIVLEPRESEEFLERKQEIISYLMNVINNAKVQEVQMARTY